MMDLERMRSSFKALFQHLLGGTEENCEKQSEQPVSGMRTAPGTS
jgi:hypothetical protein